LLRVFYGCGGNTYTKNIDEYRTANLLKAKYAVEKEEPVVGK